MVRLYVDKNLWLLVLKIKYREFKDLYFSNLLLLYLHYPKIWCLALSPLNINVTLLTPRRHLCAKSNHVPLCFEIGSAVSGVGEKKNNTGKLTKGTENHKIVIRPNFAHQEK